MERSSVAAADSASFTEWIISPLRGTSSLHGSELESSQFLMEQLRSLFVMVLWVMALMARIFLLLLPTPYALYGLTKALKILSLHGGRSLSGRTVEKLDGKTAGSAIGRTLSQVLSIVNDIPASSRKYEFARALADRILDENRLYGLGYGSINKAALAGGFARTVNLLGQSLEGLQQHEEMWIWRTLRLIPISGVLPSVLTTPLTGMCALFGQIFSPTGPQNLGLKNGMAMGTSNIADTDMAEKLAQELLWMAEKLSESGAMEEAIEQWSLASPLAELSHCASPRVQKSLVRLAALLCRGMVGDTEVPPEVRCKLLMLWIPLLCMATHGGDGPIFSSSEKLETQGLLERVILGLPDSDQEGILSIWLQEFSLSPSDWPNLQNCYNIWCHATRKLELTGRDCSNQE